MSKAVVTDEKLPDLPPPSNTVGPVHWVKENLLSSPGNIALTIFAAWLIYMLVPGTLDWTIISAVWAGGADACRANPEAACWPFVWTKWEQFIYGFYPAESRWRVDFAMLLLVVGIAYLMIEKTPGKRYMGLFMLVIYPIIAWILLYGSVFGLEEVKTNKWGGFSLTLVIALTGIVFSLPIGVVLALGRRSNMPAIRSICVVFIEFWRGVPLISVLFMSSVMLPLFLPEGVSFNDLLRALIGVALFSAAYMAEVVRGGLQAIPKGQYEGADSLGLSYWQKMRLIILPQALKIVIPGIVNTFIGLFKDTTLVLIIGLLDLLGTVQAGIADPNWSIKSVPYTGYAFTALVFFICCYGMSLYSRKIEEKLHTGHKR
ncbi:amino acid ABC transporter permease [Curvivirga aplysinae]|uniref:amino acid ABC transporter permease n=1 Tax=Curvivirga aplysinae TaxID=2529852 RepID=UPI0012BCE07A|nr:amino acid ABC transporter permease [Curvivirga aplysinae]MTI09602.1 amino acid ABC transporter permease [Curvivirga aplysinae]